MVNRNPVVFLYVFVAVPILEQGLSSSAHTAMHNFFMTLQATWVCLKMLG